jgi:hypothetical protein
MARHRYRPAAAAALVVLAGAAACGTIAAHAQSAMDFILEEQARAQGRLLRNGRIIEEAPPVVVTPAPVESTGGAVERLVCVRACDGARLPLSISRQGRDRALAEDMCHAAGGNEATTLVAEPLIPGQGFRSADADPLVPALATGRAAMSTPAGSRAASTCTGAAPLQVPILYDPTLRRGDTVMTDAGLVVFVGSGRPPFRDSDFRPATARERISHPPAPRRSGTN